MSRKQSAWRSKNYHTSRPDQPVTTNFLTVIRRANGRVVGHQQPPKKRPQDATDLSFFPVYYPWIHLFIPLLHPFSYLPPPKQNKTKRKTKRKRITRPVQSFTTSKELSNFPILSSLKRTKNYITVLFKLFFFYLSFLSFQFVFWFQILTVFFFIYWLQAWLKSQL